MGKFRKKQLCLILKTTFALCLACVLRVCSAQSLDYTMTIAESTIDMEWGVEPNATSYKLRWHKTQGFLWLDQEYSQPFELNSNGKLSYRARGLYPGVSYTFILFRNGNTSNEIILNKVVNTVPLPPENLQVLDRTSTSVLLTWSVPINSSQSYYEVNYQADGSSKTQYLNSSSNPETFNLTGLLPGHTYLLSLRAVSGDKRSNSSDSMTAVTSPAMPNLVNITATSTSSFLATWEPGNNSLQDAFEVQYRVAGESALSNTSCSASPCEFTVDGLPGQLYDLFIYAVKDTFRSHPTTVQHNTAPAPPRNLQGVGSVRGLQLTWEVAARGVFEGFLVGLTDFEGTMNYYNISKEGEKSVYTYYPTGLIGGVNYFVRVFSVTSTEKSKDSVSHLYATLPESVSSLSGSALNTSALELTWQNPFNSEYKGMELNVTSASGTDLSYLVKAGSSSYVVGGLDPGVEYEVTMVVKGKIPVDSAVANVSVRTKPESPELVSVETREETILVTLAGGSNPKGVYDRIIAKLDTNGSYVPANVEGVVPFYNLLPGMQHTLYAQTTSGSQSSDSLMQILYTKPRPARDLSIEAITSKQLRLTWLGPDKGGLDNYTVTLVPSHGAEVPTIVVVTEPTYLFDEGHPGETYNVSVVVNKGVETSAPVMEQNTTPPLPLMHLRVSMRGTDFAVISWDTPSGTVFDGFAYDFPFLNKTLEELGPSPLKVRLQPLEPNSNHTITLYVFSRRVDGTVLYSEPTAFNFSTYPESVAALQKVNATSNEITVNWTAPVSGRFQYYQLGIRPSDSPNSVVDVPLANTEYTFDGLAAGKNYTIAIRTVIGRNNFGVPVRLQALTSPLPVMELTVDTLSAAILQVNWSAGVNSTQDRFIVVQEKDGQRKSQTIVAVVNQSHYLVMLDQLLAGHTYNVTVTAVREIDTDIEESLPSMLTGTTKPFPVVNLTVLETDGIVTVRWAPAPSSLQDKYQLKYRPTLRDPGAAMVEQNAVTPSSQFSHAFPGEKYEILVFAIRKDQTSNVNNGSIIIAPLSPNVSLDLTATTTTSVTLTWTHDPEVTFVENWMISYHDSQSRQTISVPPTPGVTEFKQTLTPLTPGVTYMVEVMAVVQDVMSDKVTFNATAEPLINTNLNEIVADTTSSELVFEYRVTSADMFDSFRFSLVGEAGQNPVVKAKEDRNHRVKFSGLQSGKVYTVQAVTVSNGVASQPITKNILTVPSNVNVNFQNKSEQIIVNLVSLEGQASRYRVTCLTPSGKSCWDEEIGSEVTSVVVTKLLPYTNYTINVTTTASGPDVVDKSVESSYQVETLEAAPREVRMVKVQEDGLRTVQLSWEQPLVLNGKLRSYRLSYMGTHPAASPDQFEQDGIDANINSKRLTDLKAGYTYTFQVEAMTVALGPPGEASITLSTDVPTFKAGITAENSKPSGAKGDVSQTTASVELVNAFSDRNGPILGYVVIVSKDASASVLPETLSSWKDARDDGSIKAYQATERCSDLFSENSLCGKSASRSIRAANMEDTIMFTLGSQSGDQCSTSTFCNGPLKAETNYFVKLRAFTQAGFTDTEYSSRIRTADVPKSSGVVIGVVVAVVVVVILVVVIVVVVVIRRRRQPKRATKYRGTDGTTRSSWETSSLKNFRESGVRRFREVRDRVGQFAMHLMHVNASTTSDEHANAMFDRKFYRTFDRNLRRPVKLRDFPEHIRKMAADTDLKYAEEYEDLKEVGRDQTCHAAELPVNRPKNRFTNILPYDHSRVKLLPTDDEDGSDYINANYMPGYSSRREYIATQGPLPATGDDFWRMVWEQNVRNIVMLTRCMEKGREKSDHYWPMDSESKFYGDFQVVILNETHLPDWTITEFRMSLGDICRQVRHFHFKTWPDFGVPKNHSTLIRFVRTVREKLIKEGGPIITHCSAGVGRSGTFIVLDHCLQLSKEKDEVDIFSIVYSLRRERVLMVQTEPFRPRIETAEYMTLQQYKFIHECLACVLEGREDEATYANLGQVNVGFEEDTLDTPISLETNRKSSLYILFGRPCFVRLDSFPKVEDDEGINVEVPT